MTRAQWTPLLILLGLLLGALTLVMFQANVMDGGTYSCDELLDEMRTSAGRELALETSPACR